MNAAARKPVQNPEQLARSWYATAGTATVIAALLLVTGVHHAAIGVAGVLIALAAVTALVEGRRRSRRGHPSRLAVGAVAVLVAAANLLCLLALATGPPRR
jgi:hypothetical protein